jgi:hypothetical protein
MTEIENKKRELQSILEKDFTHLYGIQLDEEIQNSFAAIVENFATVTPPEGGFSDRMMEMTVLNAGRTSGKNYRAGNIKLDMSKFFASIVNGALTFNGAITGYIPPRYACVLGAITLWKDLYSSATVELSADDAIVLWTLWNARDDKNCVEKNKLLTLVNEEVADSSRKEITDKDLEKALSNLKKIRCIKESQSDNSKWWLSSWVSIKY